LGIVIAPSPFGSPLLLKAAEAFVEAVLPEQLAREVSARLAPHRNRVAGVRLGPS
jgi:hypothetical protein